MLVPATFCNFEDDPLFETIAFLSTMAFIGVFVLLFQMDRAGRKEE